MIFNKNKTFSMMLLFVAVTVTGMAQSNTLTLEECYQLAKQNYPAIKKLDLIQKTKDLDLENTSKGFLPQLTLTGQATYQSETVGFGDALGSLPSGISFPSISKDQYKVQGEVNQLLYDGGKIRQEKKLVEANAELQEQNLEANLYAIKDRINNIFFSVLLIEEQIKQNEVNKSSLQTQVEKTTAQLANGVAFRSNVDELKAEVLNVEMKNTEYAANRSAYLEMLSQFIGKEISENTRLQKPGEAIDISTNNRPELKAFDLQKSIYDAQEAQLKSAYLPQMSAFFQGAYGRPTLNIVKNEFGPWYVTGVRFNWSLGSLYSLSNKKKILQLNKQSVEADRETFLLNANLDLGQQNGQVRKYETLIRQDDEAIALRSSVTKSAEAQLANGVITTHEYIQKLNAENLARQTKILHEIQLLQSKHKQKFITGN